MENINSNVNDNVQVEEAQKEIVDTQNEALEQETKSYTQEELDKIIKSNVDRAVAKATKEAEQKQEEAKKLAKMNAEQKANYEIEKTKKELDEREAKIAKRELSAEAKSMLSDRGLSTELHSLLNYESAETVKNGIDALEKAIQTSVQKAVEERLKGNSPKISTASRLTRDDILNIENPIERQKKIAENIELFN